jgi:hypothetical protein
MVQMRGSIQLCVGLHLLLQHKMGPCFDNYVIHALLSSHSDHCSLLLEDDSVPQRPQTFKFENVWLRLPGFNDDVHMA